MATVKEFTRLIIAYFGETSGNLAWLLVSLACFAFVCSVIYWVTHELF